MAAGVKKSSSQSHRPLAPLLFTMSPAALMLCLFYSLAIHMHVALGGWPQSIGEAGFPPALLIHSTIAEFSFAALLGSAFLLLPIGLLVCALVQRLRRFLIYLSLFGGSSLLCLFGMAFAPAEFLNWWMD